MFWVAAVDGSVVRELYVPEKHDFLLGWMSDRTYLVESTCFECSQFNLRKVDIETSTVTPIYPGDYCSSVIAPQHHTLLLAFGGTFCGEHPVENGIYWYDLELGKPKLIQSGSDWFVTWSSKWNTFIVDNYALDQTRMISPDGKIVGEKPGDEWPLASPDGKWVAVNQGVFVSDAFDRAVSTFDGYFYTWLPDSSGFFVREKDGQFSLHLQDTNWEPEYLPILPTALSSPMIIFR